VELGALSPSLRLHWPSVTAHSAEPVSHRATSAFSSSPPWNFGRRSPVGALGWGVGWPILRCATAATYPDARTNWRALGKSLWPIPIGFVSAFFYHRQLPPALLTAGRYPLAPRPTLHALRPTLHAPRSTGSAVDAARRAGYSTPHPEWVNMLRHATFSGFARSLASQVFGAS